MDAIRRISRSVESLRAKRGQIAERPCGKSRVSVSTSELAETGRKNIVKQIIERILAKHLLNVLDIMLFIVSEVESS